MTVVGDEQDRDRSLPDIDWRLLPPGATRDVVSTPSGGLARIRLGEPVRGRVVLAPGCTGSKEDFLLMLPLLAAAGYQAEAFDLAGQFESAQAGPQRLSPARDHYDFPLFVDDLLAVIAAGAGPAHLLGYSFAGMVAQLAAVQEPGSVASLTLLSTPPAAGQVFRGLRYLGPFSGGVGARTSAALMLWGIRNNLNRVPPGRIEFVRSRFALTDRRSVNDMLALMRAMPEVRDDLARTAFPKLVAVGSRDLWPSAQHAAFAQRIGARLAVYETGHSPCETAPHQLVRDMLALFEQVDADGRE